MADPTEAEIKTQISNLVNIFNELRLFGGVNATNLLGLIDTYEQSLEGEYNDRASATVAAMRAAYAASMDQLGPALTPQLRSYGRLKAFPESDPVAIMARLYQYMVDNTLSVNSREFTFGTPSAGGSNVGNGVINRLNLDENGFDIEAQTPDAKVAKCVADAYSGAVQHEEVFEFRGATAERDLIKITGSGRVGLIRGLSARDSLNFLGNPSFEVGTSGSDVTDWTFATGTAANTALSSTYYRGYQGVGTPYSLQINNNIKITQAFSNRNANFNPAVPVYAQIAVNRNGSGADGTLTFTFGDQTVTQTISALGASGWNVIRIAIGTKNWYKTFNATSPIFAVEVSGGSTFGLLVDDIIVAPFSSFDGSWYAPVGGSTPWLKDDSFTWSDSQGVSAKLQQAFWRAYGMYLPASKTGAETWTDP